jgi:predicted dehydrogenase
MERLRLGIIGLGQSGQMILRALRGSQAIEIVGVADRETSLAEAASATTKAPAFGDARSLVARGGVQAVALAVPPGEAPEIVGACAERGIAVWTDLPLARNLDEAVAMTQQCRRAGVKFAVGTQRRFMPGYRNAWDRRHEVGGVFLARAHYLFNWGQSLTWHGEGALAGGGALLELGYHMIDLLVWFFGLPEEVYGLTAIVSGGGKGVPEHDTDDTACAVLNFAGGRMACLAASRSCDPVSEELSLHGRAGSLTAGPEACVLRNADGVVIEQIERTYLPTEAIALELEAFAGAVISGAERYACSAWENLLTHAVIDAVYLAARTGQPESPARLLHAHKLRVEDCLKLCPIE